MGQKNGLRAFGNNSTPPKVDEIWNSVSQMWGLVLADFGRDPCSSDSLRGVVFQKKKLKKLLTKFRRHNSTMITNAENSRPNGPPMGCLVSTFNVRIDSRFPLRRCAPESDLPKFSATSVLRYRPIVCYSTGAAQSHRYGWLWCGLLSDILKKSRLNWKLKVSNTADNAGITQSQTRDTIGIVECRN